MNLRKQFILIRQTIFVCLFAMLGISQALADECYVMVTSADELVDGEKYLIVYKGSSSYTVMKKYVNNENNHKGLGIPYAGIYNQDIVSLTDEMNVLTLHKNDTTWHFTNLEGRFLSTTSSTSSNVLKTLITKNEYCDFSIDINSENGEAVIAPVKKKGYSIRYNSSSTLFSVYNGTQKPVQLYRYIGKYYLRKVGIVDRFGTICLPYDVKELSESGACFYEIVGKTVIDGQVSDIVMREVKELKACTPYIYYTTDDRALIIPEGEAVEVTDERPTAIGLVGNLGRATISAPVGSYAIKNGLALHEVLPGANVTVRQYCAYVTLDNIPEYTDALPQGAKRMRFTDSTTGVILNSVSQIKGEEHVYNILGQKVDDNNKGIIVKNGKKMIVR